MLEQKPEELLRKEIGLWVATSIVIGSVIGSGIFMKPGKVIAAAGDSTMALWAWILGGIITLASGLTIAEVAVQIPKTGGLYVYLEEVYGKLWGYLCGWVQTLIYGPTVMGALALYFGTLLINFFGWSSDFKVILGVLTVLLLFTVNTLGTKYGGILQTVATAGKLIPIALIAIFGILKGNGQILNVVSGVTEKAGMGAAILATLWAYDGWALVGFVAGEMKNPGKVLPRAIVGGLTVVTAAYLLVNLAMLHVIPAHDIVKYGPEAAGTVAMRIFGGLGGKLISIGILVSIFGCLNGKILTFPRVPLAMAERGQLPGWRVLSQVHPRLRTPVWANLMQLVLAIMYMTVGDPDRLSDIAIWAIYIFYVQAFYAVYLLRRKNPDAHREYSTPGYPFVPLIAIFGAGYIVITTVINKPLDTLYAIALAAVGLPLYWYLNRQAA